MAKITLTQADAIIDGAMAKGREMDFKPLSVAVLDDGGNLVAFKKSDNSSLMRFQIATGKAWGSLGMGTSSRNLANVYEQRPHFIEALMDASGGRVVPVAGGVLIRNANGEVVGAVGISGDNSDNDEIACMAGIDAAGLVGD